MNTYKTEGIIIKRRNLAEADKMITVFTRKNGKLQLKACGVRKITSRRSPHVELLNYSVLSVYKSTHGIPILTEATTIENFSDIKNDLPKIGYAYHICELIDSLCPENQENEYIYLLLISTLTALSKQQEVSAIVHDFEIQLLTHLGFYSQKFAIKEFNTSFFIEGLLERKLKSQKMFPRFA